MALINVCSCSRIHRSCTGVKDSFKVVLSGVKGGYESKPPPPLTPIYFFMYNIQHCFICRPSDSTMSKDAGIEPHFKAGFNSRTESSNSATGEQCTVVFALLQNRLLHSRSQFRNNSCKDDSALFSRFFHVFWGKTQTATAFVFLVFPYSSIFFGRLFVKLVK